MSQPAGACLPGHTHEPEPVTLLDGTTIDHVCRHCLVKLRDIPGLGPMPYSDDGQPLPTLPDPGITIRDGRVIRP